MPRIFLPLLKPTHEIRISGEKARYLTTVLRCSVGEEVTVFDGKGLSYRTIIKGISKKDIVAEIIDITSYDAESPIQITLIQGLLKGEKMDLVIQKTTELGVSEIIPAVTERSQVKDTRKVERWRKIAEDAARQCGRSMVPVIHESVLFGDLLASFSGSTAASHHGIIFWEKGGMRLADALKMKGDSRSFMIAVGPEGGFTGEEVRVAESREFLTASLGKRILRSETAAISAVAIVQFLFGDLNSPFQ
ncbi:MAG TPA: 16S rRNA (uracil(1498)-N(3))-methyltransferase [Thermodesulfovibrionales bacterium]|jgi:16S rRNA (uracil1498-N3)-methyltransferase|nr:16S rRNA (uracil(1498)-N(3))-methyltransferase [Thermodesulfovibrionales bacterium]